MSDPFKIRGPGLISFSGGRTSALMLRRCADAGLDADVHVLFANTGKERSETLDFVRDVEEQWRIPVTWVERDPEVGFREVSYETASRAGEPFHELIVERNFLPNPVTRFCTQELKIRVMRDWMIARGYEHWTNVVGLRADEPGRVSRMRNGKPEMWDVVLPLSDAGVRVGDVDAFWAAQPFNLRLQKWEGNCDLCFLKGRAKRTRIMRDKPELADWWIGVESMPLRAYEPRVKEARVLEHVDDDTAPMLPFGDEFLRRVIQPKEQRGDRSGLFRYDAPRYSDLLSISQQPMFAFDDEELNGEADDDIGDCVCAA